MVNNNIWVSSLYRGHVEDIYDACWSASSSYLVTGSVDNTAIIWDISKGILYAIDIPLLFRSPILTEVLRTDYVNLIVCCSELIMM